MPKIIVDLRPRLLDAARSALLNGGYNTLSLRSLALECRIAVGTIYNYFDDKNTLIANVILIDWNKALSRMDVSCQEAASFAEGMSAIFLAIRDFSQIYAEVFSQFSQSRQASGISALRHKMLRGQIAERISLLLRRFDRTGEEEFVPILSEAVLSCAMQSDISADMITRFSAGLFPHTEA